MDTAPVNASRAERMLAYMVAGIVGVSILSFLAVMVGSLMDSGTQGWASHGIWPFVIMFPWFGLPLAMVLLITLVVLSSIRRTREARRNN